MRLRWIFSFVLFFVIPVSVKAETGIIEEVLPVIIQAESSGNPLAINKKEGSYGLCQIKAEVLKDYNAEKKRHYSLKDLLTAKINKKICRWYLRKLERQLRKHNCLSKKSLVLSYNWGPGNFLKWKKKHPFKEVPDWVKRHPNRVYRRFLTAKD